MDRGIPGRHNYIILCQTVRRRPRVRGLHSRRILKRSLCKRRNRAARLEQTRARSWRLHTRQQILFTVEPLLALRLRDGRSVIVWGKIWHTAKTRCW